MAVFLTEKGKKKYKIYKKINGKSFDFYHFL